MHCSVVRLIFNLILLRMITLHCGFMNLHPHLSSDALVYVTFVDAQLLSQQSLEANFIPLTMES